MAPRGPFLCTLGCWPPQLGLSRSSHRPPPEPPHLPKLSLCPHSPPTPVPSLSPWVLTPPALGKSQKCSHMVFVLWSPADVPKQPVAGVHPRCRRHQTPLLFKTEDCAWCGQPTLCIRALVGGIWVFPPLVCCDSHGCEHGCIPRAWLIERYSCHIQTFSSASFAPWIRWRLQLPGRTPAHQAPWLYQPYAGLPSTCGRPALRRRGTVSTCSPLLRGPSASGTPGFVPPSPDPPRTPRFYQLMPSGGCLPAGVCVTLSEVLAPSYPQMTRRRG